jgi:DNA transformation protein and related proteins
MVMPYYEVPIDVLEDRYALSEWARKACLASKNNSSTRKKMAKKKD